MWAQKSHDRVDLGVFLNSSGEEGNKHRPFQYSILQIHTHTRPYLSSYKSRSHMHSEVFNSRSLNFVTSLEGIMVLNSELQSINSSLT